MLLLSASALIHRALLLWEVSSNLCCNELDYTMQQARHFCSGDLQERTFEPLKDCNLE